MEKNNSNNSALMNAGSIVAAGILIAGAIIWSNGHPAPQPTQSSPSNPPVAAQAVDISKVKTAGNSFIGSPNAPVTIAYWFDYQCPFCKRNEETAMPEIIKNYVKAGKVKIVFKDFQFLGTDSQTLGKIGRAVWEVAPKQFYAWHKAVYDNQGTENTGWATSAKIKSITLGVLGASKTSKVLTLAKTNSVKYQKEMDADKAEGSDLGVTGTPSFIIGKKLIIGAVPYSQLQSAIETVLNKK